VADASRGEVRTEESGGPLRTWRHRLTAEPVDDRSCRYADEVELDAGRLTPATAAVVRLFYRYRQHRWKALCRVLA
jgi:hypothetical protein